MEKDKIVEKADEINEKLANEAKKVEEDLDQNFKDAGKTIKEDLKSVEKKFIDKVIAKKGESTEDAKERIKNEVKDAFRI